MRESISEKALRYVGEGRLTVRTLDEAAGTVRASVHGNATYSVSYSRSSGWRCTCPARGRCCHREALGLVVAVESVREPS